MKGNDKRKLITAWKNFILNGEVEDEIDPEIGRSWQRCTDYQIDPFANNKTYVLQQNNLQEKLEKFSNLIRVATPIMKELYQAIKGSNFAVILTDKWGYILKVIGDSNFEEKAKDIYLIEGANWAEKQQGTNAIGTVIEELSPLTVYASEHYSEQNHFLTCSAAPIFNARNEFIGILDISGNYKLAHAHTLGLVMAAARLIQNRLLVKDIEEDLVLSEKKQSLILNSVDQGLFNLNREGIITQINQKGSQVLGYPPQDCIGKRIEDFFPNSTVDSLLESVKAEQTEEMVWNLKKEKFQLASKAKLISNAAGDVTDVIIEVKDSVSKKSAIKKQVKTNYSFADIIGQSEAITKVIDLASKVAVNDSSVLLLGSSGTGKELFAQAIHNKSPRRDNKFVTLNCGAIPDNLIESELFGYEEGAFTGAKKKGREGKFQLADGGTIFLDEIGEMNLSAQVKLLRVLQENEVSPVGSDQVIPVNVRVIAATNQDLKERIAKKEFREDLYYRLNVIEIKLPALKERGNDIIMLAENFIKKHGQLLGKSRIKIEPEVEKALLNHDWPGNVRELENIIERALNLVEGNLIKMNHLPDYLQGDTIRTKPKNKLLSLQEAEVEAIKNALQYFDGNISQTADCLQIARNTLYRKIDNYNIELE
ncbi:sigma-54-dependent Fis family transcriptional regulator [Natroniella acetigena]|uniref:sigma-54-dependent Fis family transcriptional regulator n=1 Tax=Natroniella acetigena TaxID=52004 RepID=UPI002009F73A|nr:sigma-54-dependent Fis family transcriptional regulator [Natroniella acetigena]MCK8828307.1 sigma-54-dependent Fis family transcriptional regulator [Natroniella acetigena]